MAKRRAVLALLGITACGAPHGVAANPSDAAKPARAAAPDLEAARELDQQGVRAFRESRYADAIGFFRAAYRLGAPSSELWNMARSYEKVDDPEAAAGAIEHYLAQGDVAGPDRGEAERELSALRARPSVLTVTTAPSGAALTVDGHPASGVTPVSVEVGPGAHTLAVHRDGYAVETRRIETHFGRAEIVSVELAKATGHSP